jgi:hypothetical protein
MGINVFEGEVTAKGTEETMTANAGQAISIVGSAISVIDLDINSLNDFNLDKAQVAGADRSLCFTNEQLAAVVTQRELEKTQAVDEADANRDVIDEEGNGSSSASSKDGKSSSSQSSSSSGGSSSSSGGSSNSSGSSSGSSSSNSSGDSKNTYSCTIEIRCDTILNNMGNLEAGKEGYVPKSGVILNTTTVKFTEGETVFDVLNRVCKNKGIQIEYSWTAMYNSYYIEGINNLYEFDCGQQSGWMYKVNGWFPNYGCSSYTLKNGDTIVWCYTCNGLGEDVGGSVY